MEDSIIIDNIINTAHNSAAALVKTADAEKGELIETASAELALKQKTELEKAEREAQLILERRVCVANLESNKTLLKARQQVLKNAYEQVYNKVLNMTDNIYREFIANLIIKFAENNDRVMICEKDDKRITSEFIKKIADQLKINLSLSSQFHNGKGGIILSSSKYDKNLTLETLIAQLRETTESKCVQKLFSPDNGQHQDNRQEKKEHNNHPPKKEHINKDYKNNVNQKN